MVDPPSDANERAEAMDDIPRDKIKLVHRIKNNDLLRMGFTCEVGRVPVHLQVVELIVSFFRSLAFRNVIHSQASPLAFPHLEAPS